MKKVKFDYDVVESAVKHFHGDVSLMLSMLAEQIEIAKKDKADKEVLATMQMVKALYISTLEALESGTFRVYYHNEDKYTSIPLYQLDWLNENGMLTAIGYYEEK